MPSSFHPTRRSRWRVALGLFATSAAVAFAAIAPVAPASATPVPATSATASTSGAAHAEPVCGDPQPGEFTCFSIRRTNVRHALGVQHAGASDAPQGYAPNDLRSAYALPSDGGEGATIAIVDAFDDPTAEADLAVYRQQYGLPACTTANGCFRKVSERGGSDYPDADANWAGEISLDLDMVSAIAPKAHIILVEADSAYDDDLGAAENTAVALGAGYVSNSWGGYNDTASDLAEDESYYNHPGTAIVFSSGDDGYGVSYPAASPYVTSVGGTSLTRDDSTRGWHESVWNSAPVDSLGMPHWGAPGSGCSQVEPKPTFQSDQGCAGRMVTDVSAVADPETGVAVYDSFSDAGGWNVYGGTSASAPIIAGVYALAGTPATGTYPSSYPYERPGALNDVTEGDNASCDAGVPCGYGTTPDCTPSYFCQAGTGYDGPTGLGTPEGIEAFRPGPHGVVSGTVTDSSTSKPMPGVTVELGDYHATTNASGHYVLDVPAGSYDLHAGAFGYHTADLGTTDVTDGAALTKDIALAPVPSGVVSGTVLDGGGHRWGLYAKITVDGVPGTTYTDPRTGAYSLKLPIGTTYSFHVTALYAGYQQGTFDADVEGASMTHDVQLPLDTTGTMAPGYRLDFGGGGEERFTTPTTPDGWTVKNNNDAGGWNFNDPLNRGNQTGGDGFFAEVDDFAQGWKAVDTELISPTYDFSDDATPRIDFDTALPSLYRLGDLTADVDVSTDGGASWTNVWEQTNIETGPAHETVSLAAYGGDSSVQVRFHYVGSLTGIWEVDNITIGNRKLLTLPGALLVGTVTDHNTGAGVVGATVTSLATPDDVTHTVASPDDPAMPGDFYDLFTSALGRPRFTAGLPAFGYPNAGVTVTTSMNGVSSADFSLQPAALKLSATSLTGKVGWGSTHQVGLKITNTGSAATTVSIGEEGVAPAKPSTLAAPATVPSSLTPLTVTDVAKAAAATAATSSPWKAVPNLPAASFGGVAAINGGTLYAGLGELAGGAWSDDFYALNAAKGTWTTLASPVTTRYAPAYGFIRGKLYVVGGRDSAGNGIPGGEVYDPATNAWSQIAPAPHALGGEGFAVVKDKLYVIGGCDIASGCVSTDVQIYDPVSNSWSAGPDYPEPTSYLSCGTIDGAVYCAGGAGEPADGSATVSKSTFVLNPGARAWTRKASTPTAFWGAATTAANGLLLVGGGQVVTDTTASLTAATYAYNPATDTWSRMAALPQPVMGAAGAPGWYVVGGQLSSQAPVSDVEKLPGYDAAHADVPWLSEKQTMTIGAGKTATVTVTLNARSMGAADLGAHRARLVIDSDSPYPTVRVPVTMTVTAPKGWGRLAGTVRGRTGHGKATPLAGAVVDIATSHGHVRVRTASNGTYGVWFRVSGKVTVTVTKAGYVKATRKVSPKVGATVTTSLTLTRKR